MARFEAARAIANVDVNNTIVIKVPVRMLQKDELDEAWYNNKLYDVVKREKIRGTQFVFLLRDEDEQSVLDSGADYFRDDENTLSQKDHHFISVKKFSFRQEYNCMSNLSGKKSIDQLQLKLPTVKDNFYHPSVCTDVPSPPPRSALFL